MKGLITGIFLGVGIGWLFAPMRGEEMRNLVSERFQELRENEIVKQYIPQLGDPSQLRTGLDDLAKFALNRVKANESTLNDLARLAVNKAMNYRVSLNDLAGFASTAWKRAG
jgi:gas vesicle protein